MKIVLSSLLVCVSLVACGGGSDSDSSAIRIGLITQKNATSYQTLTGSVLLAQDMVAKGGGLLGGRSIRFEERDEANQDADAAALVAPCESLIDAGVKVILGPFLSPSALACAPITGAASVLQMSTTAGSDLLTNIDDNDFTFRATVRSGYTASAVAQYLYNTEGARKAAVLALTGTDYLDEANSFSGAFRELGGSVVVETYTYDPASFNARSHLNVVFADRPDVIYLTGLPVDASALLQAWNKTDYAGKWVLGAELLAPALTTNVGGEKMQGIRVAAQHGDLSGFLELAIAYQALNNFSIEQYSAAVNIITFETALLLMLAVEGAGTDRDGTLIRDALRMVSSPPGQQLKFTQTAEMLQILRDGGDIDYAGISSALDFDPHGDIVSDIDLYVFGTQTVRIERILVPGVDFVVP